MSRLSGISNIICPVVTREGNQEEMDQFQVISVGASLSYKNTKERQMTAK